MITQIEKAQQFHALHIKGAPLVLFNAWDAGSAKEIEKAGAKAIATGSWSVATAYGFDDGEKLPFDLAIANIQRIAQNTQLPVSMDLESGYGDAPEQVANAVAAAIQAGAIGCNIEDSFPADGSLRDVHAHAARIKAMRAEVDARKVNFFINARTDVFFQSGADTHNMAMVDACLQRAEIYARAGANGLFVPGVVADELIAAIAARSPLPVNVMVSQATPTRARLAELGVARISYGPGPYRIAMKALIDAAKSALQ
jgi:2-methylisocitrate lyase-like PEP mutase family enzyme